MVGRFLLPIVRDCCLQDIKSWIPIKIYFEQVMSVGTIVNNFIAEDIMESSYRMATDTNSELAIGVAPCEGSGSVSFNYLDRIDQKS